MNDSHLKKSVKGTLLIAEDEVELRDILVELLQPLADKIHVAQNGKEALQQVRTGEIDAVLTDIKMPIMTGLQFLAEIRSALFQTPVIVLTGQGDFATVQEALRLDATDFVEKPCEGSYIQKAVSKALEYGLALRLMEAEIDQFYSQSGLPADQIAKIKKIRKVTAGMKIGFSAYAKKSA